MYHVGEVMKTNVNHLGEVMTNVMKRVRLYQQCDENIENVHYIIKTQRQLLIYQMYALMQIFIIFMMITLAKQTLLSGNDTSLKKLCSQLCTIV